MRYYSFQDLRKIWPYSLGALPFILAFGYQLAYVWPQRPATPDPARGFIIPTEIEQQAIYISQMDIILLLVCWLCAAAIMGLGMWRVWKSRRA